MNRRWWLLFGTSFLLIGYLAMAFTGALGRSPLLTQQVLAVTLGISIGRTAGVWLHN